MSNKFMISCDEATAISDKKQYGEATRMERVKLNFHLMLCKHCRAYSMQNNYISRLLSKYLHDSCETDHLVDKEKQELEEKLKIHIKDISKN